MRLFKKSIIIFLILMIGYHVLYTLFVYGFNIGSFFIISALKDIVWVGLIGIIILLGKKYVFDFLVQWRQTLILLCILIIWSFIISLYHDVSIKMILVGFKYDIFPLLILLSGILIGIISYKLEGENNTGKIQSIDNKGRGFIADKSIIKIEYYLYYMIYFIVVGGFIWQIGKIFIPEFFYRIGYGPVGDYVLGANPPLYYRTGPGGMMRLQGFFSGPNNYGYFLVSFFSIIIIIFLRTFSKDFKFKDYIGSLFLFNKKHSGEEQYKKDKRYHFLFNILTLFFIILYFISCVWTLSRGVLVGIGVQLFLLIWFLKKSWRRKLIVGMIFGFFLIILLSLQKQESTVLHFQAWMTGIDAFLKNLWGYGLGSAGPAIHYNGIYLPENYYLQLLLDIGIPGILLWIGIIISIFRGFNILNIYKCEKDKIYSEEKFLFILLFFGFIGLLTEGLFLHVLEDSMVNYLFLVIFGIIIGGLSQKEYIKY